MASHSGLPDLPNLETLPADGGPHFNRLIFEKSPYLLQHAKHPVDWFPWGEAAFKRAKQEQKPLFLSIGYATCHWCHVMADESFADEEVAQLLNRDFIAIKVDKEERPDIDELYMAACVALNGHGGWPLTVLLTPDQRPFFAATYLPKHSRGGRMGMLEFLPRIREYWVNEPQQVADHAQELTETIQQFNGSAAGHLPEGILEQTYRQLEGKFDQNYGGFGSPPKFPMAHHLIFLARVASQSWAEHAQRMLEQTLLAMRAGGIFDQLGFGFHRYSTDQVWLLPHFEKMLYDQAMLVMAYLEAFGQMRDPRFACVAREIFHYVLRDMTHPDGGFYSAEDADSEGEEGKFYLWSIPEIQHVLGTSQGSQFAQCFQAESEGNFREEATGRFSSANILHLPLNYEFGSEIPSEADGFTLNPMPAACRAMFESRKQRVHPLKDDKILTDWNGLMIAALAQGYALLGDQRYLHAAEKAALFLENHLTKADGTLWKRFRAGEAGLPAHLEDYAYLLLGYLALFRASGHSVHLQKALNLAKITHQQFFDEASGAYFQTAGDSAPLIARTMRFQDGALPSGNSVMAYALAMLGRLTGDIALEEQAYAVIQAFGSHLQQQPQTSTFMMVALDFLENPSQEVVVVGALEDQRTLALWKVVQEAYHPRRTAILKQPGDEHLARLIPFLGAMEASTGAPSAFVCSNRVCERPIHSVDLLEARLNDFA